MTPYLTHLLIIYCIFSVLVLGFALTLGWLGISNLAHVGFASVGAYASAILTIRAGLPVPVGILAGAVAGMALSLVVSALTRRVRGDFMVVVSLGLQLVLLSIWQNWTTLTRGTLGIPGIPRPPGFEENRMFLLLALTLLVCVVLVLRRITSSPFGRVMSLVRDDELAAQTFGKNTGRVKQIGLLVAGAFGGLAGALLAHYLQFIDPKTFHVSELVFILSATIIGGLGSLRGAIAGTALVFFVPEILRFASLPPGLVGPLRLIIFAGILLLVIIFKPRGMFGKITIE